MSAPWQKLIAQQVRDIVEVQHAVSKSALPDERKNLLLEVCADLLMDLANELSTREPDPEDSP